MPLEIWGIDQGSQHLVRVEVTLKDKMLKGGKGIYNTLSATVLRTIVPKWKRQHVLSDSHRGRLKGRKETGDTKELVGGSMQWCRNGCWNIV